VSAGILIFRRRSGGPEFLLAHPGGPFWANKDEAAWSIPKGLVEPGEDPWRAALREVEEELGWRLEEEGDELTFRRTKSGKWIHCWLIEADLDPPLKASGGFEMEWPPRSGRTQVFQEVDRAAYFPADEALVRIHLGQRPILEEAIARLAA
jgi:predicted NUDIX family NTP pyrophosphohydrolase